MFKTVPAESKGRRFMIVVKYLQSWIY